jgi:ribosome maturation factor RimP
MSLGMSLDTLLGPIREQVAALGFELADLRQVGTAGRPILQLRVDRPESRPGQGVTADDCATISRSLERFLETRGLVGPRYVLEVSSPGVERPLRWPEHWRRFIGHRARIRAEGVGGRPEVEILAVPDDEHVLVRLPDGSERTVALSAVKDAHLVADWDALKKQSRRAQ